VTFQELMREFARGFDIHGIEPEPDGSYRFTFDDALTVTCVPAGSSRMILRGPLESLPDDAGQADELLKPLLKQQLGRVRDQDAILAVEPETREVFLFSEVSLDQTAGEFAEGMEEFVNTLEKWSSLESSAGPMAGGMPFVPIMP